MLLKSMECCNCNMDSTEQLGSVGDSRSRHHHLQPGRDLKIPLAGVVSSRISQKKGVVEGTQGVAGVEEEAEGSRTLGFVEEGKEAGVKVTVAVAVGEERLVDMGWNRLSTLCKRFGP